MQGNRYTFNIALGLAVLLLLSPLAASNLFAQEATTTYDILRVLGVPLGKMDFLGQMKIGA